jgi:hypothetical protein
MFFRTPNGSTTKCKGSNFSCSSMGPRLFPTKCRDLPKLKWDLDYTGCAHYKMTPKNPNCRGRKATQIVVEIGRGIFSSHMTLSTPSRQSNWWEDMWSRKHHRTSLYIIINILSSDIIRLHMFTEFDIFALGTRIGHVLFAIASLVSKSCSKNLTLRLATCTNLKPGVTTATVFTNKLVPITNFSSSLS